MDAREGSSGVPFSTGRPEGVSSSKCRPSQARVVPLPSSVGPTTMLVVGLCGGGPTARARIRSCVGARRRECDIRSGTVSPDQQV